MNYQDNKESLEELRWAVSESQGEFKLIFAHCKYAYLHKQMSERLQEICSFQIQKIVLKSSDQRIYRTIQEKVKDKDKQPEALMVFGLESLIDIDQDIDQLDQSLRSMNQVRGQFRKNFHFPLIFWVNDEVQQRLTRSTPDFQTWGALTEFAISDVLYGELFDQLNTKANLVFSKFLQVDTNEFLSELSIKLENLSEIELAQKHLEGLEQKLDPALEARIKFILGRNYFANYKFDNALRYFQQSLNLWKEKNRQETRCDNYLTWQLLLLFHIGLCHCHQIQEPDFEKFLQDCFDLLSQCQNLNLSNKFIAQFGESLQLLQAWERLETLANKLLQQPPSENQTFSIAQAYGFLAEIALVKSDWSEANELALKALQTAAQIPEGQQFGRTQYKFLLAKSQAKLGKVQIAIENLEAARLERNLNYNPRLHVKILELLRSLYFQKGEYLEAFKIKQKKLAIEQQYRLRAFIGSGRLQPERQIIYSDSGNPQIIENFPEEIIASSRKKDVEKLIERISRPDRKLTVIHGKPGVGRTSLLQAGLIPALKKEEINNRKVLTIFQQDYRDDWIKKLGKHLVEEIKKEQDAFPFDCDLKDTDKILEQLRKNSRDNKYLTVLIFDELEYFFFHYQEAEHKKFHDFLDQCLNIPDTKVILSLRDNNLSLLGDLNRLSDSQVVNQEIFNSRFLHDLGNFSLEDARLIIENLAETTQLSLQSLLIERIIKDLTNNVGKIIPFELQIVAYQLEKEQIKTLEEYQIKGSRQGLIERYLQAIIKDCGAENEQNAKLILYFLTDKDNNLPQTNLNSLAQLLEVTIDKLEPILYILMKSWLLIEIPEFNDKTYKLAFDDLPSLINRSQEFIEIVELEQTKQQLRQSLLQAEVAEVEQLSFLAQAQFLANNQIVALVNAVKASKKLLKTEVKSETKSKILERIQQVVYGVKELNRFERHQDSVWTLNISNNGEFIASASFDGIINLWRFDGTLINSFLGHNEQIWSLAFSPDDQILVSASDDQTIKLWKLDGTLIDTFKEHRGGVRSVCFTPDSQMLASASEDKTIKLWKFDDGTLILIDTFKEHSGGIRSVCFTPDSQMLASASDDKTIKLWQLDGTLIDTFKGHQDSVWDLSFSSDGKKMLASASDDKTIRLWKLDGTLISSFLGHSGGVRSVCFSRDSNMLASASADGAVKLWHLNGTEIQTFLGHNAGVRGISFSRDNKILVSGSADRTVRLWQLDEIPLKTLKDHSDCIWGIAFNQNSNLLASGSDDKTIKLWQSDGKLIKTFPEQNGSVRGISFSSNGDEMIASGSVDGSVKIWRNDGTLIKSFEGHKARVWSVHFSSDNKKLASASDDKTIKLWCVDDGKEIRTIYGHKAEVRSVHFSPDGNKIASASTDGIIKIWLFDGTEIISVQAHRAGIRSISFSPDGEMLASASADKTVKVWQVNDIERGPIKTFQGHSAGVWTVRFSPDSKKLASGSSDTTLKLWQVNGNEIHTFHGHKAAILSVSFSPDGTTLASATADRTIKLWQLDNLRPQATDLKGMLSDCCNWLQNYLRTNPNVNESDRSVCDLNKPIIKHKPSDLDQELRQTKQKLQIALKTEKEQRQRAEIAEIKALNSLAEALWLSNDQLGALVNSLKAGKQLKELKQSKEINLEASLEVQTTNLLGNIFYRIQEFNRIQAHKKFIHTVRFSPKRNIFASASVDGTIKIWDIKGELIANCQEHHGEVNGVRFHPNSKILVSAGADGTVRIWKLNGNLIRTFDKAHNKSINNVSINRQGNRIASASADKLVKLWDFKGNLIQTFEGHSSFVNSVHFSPDGDKVVSGSADKTLKLWNIDEQTCKTFKGHSAEVNSVQFSPNGQTIISASADKTLKIWNLDGSEINTFKGHTSHIKNVCFSHNGEKIASAGADGNVKLWDIDGTEIQNFQVRSSGANYVSFSSDNEKIAVASNDHAITLWNLIEKGLKTFREQNHELRTVCFSPNDQFIAVANTDGTIKILTIEGKQLQIFKAHYLEINSICFSPDSQKIASASGDHLVKIWNLEGQELGCFQEHHTWVISVCFSPDGSKILSSSADGEIKCCLVDNDQETCLQFKADSKAIRLINWSPDGNKIASVSINDIVRIWSNDGQIIGEFEANVRSICFSPDSKFLALGMDNGTVQIHSLDDHTIDVFTKHSKKVNSIGWSADGKTITSASVDGTVKHWDLKGNDLNSLQGPSNWLKGIWVSPNGKKIASITTDNTLILWESDLNFDLDYLLERGEDWVADYCRGTIYLKSLKNA